MSKKMNIPFSPPDITQAEIDAVVDVLKSGWLTTGPVTKDFEVKLAQFCKTARVATMNSATAAMEMTLRLLDIGPGDEVITSAYTYTASASVIAHVGAKIVLVDTTPDSLEMDYDALEAAITDKTKAIIPVDIAGVMCDYDKIFEVAESKKDLYHPKAGTLQEHFDRVVILSDSAHSLGAQRNGKMAGAYADFSCFSFHAVKNLTTAEGGAVTWQSIPGVDDEEIYNHFMRLILHGQTKDALSKNKAGAWEYDIVAPYFKANLTDIHAALGREQLKRYPALIARRHEIIAKYNAGFAGEDFITPVHKAENAASSGHLYLLRVKDFTLEERNELIKRVAEKGIATNVHYKPLPLLTAYHDLGFEMADYPNAYQQYINEITLPLHTLLTDEEVDFIIETIQTEVAKMR
ncbi:DegT/DnrJ/EryC1/StrS family aminotransferase [Allofustis seminis]|uniref:DegT/DnrJ/EryC1/StrS family aminotransferase n=1 Tax=Allofustis seminis TaxID=166939 RepID=UPI000363EB71|nr:DegT/DnrJ/EryC1/StrS family aminotransferase [Allofustis seminis]